MTYRTMNAQEDSMQFSVSRARWVMAAMAVAFVLLLGRVAYLQTYGREATIRRAERQQHMSETLFARRGNIYDATGNILAGTVQNKALFIDPKFMLSQFMEQGLTPSDIQQRIHSLADLIEYDRDELVNLLDERSESRFLKLQDNVGDDYQKAVQSLGLPGVGTTPVHARYYPMGSLAAHVLGGVGFEGAGLEGVELKFEKLLAGKHGYKRTMKDARRRGIAVAAEDYLPPQHGQHLMLTIDSNIQMIAEQELAATCEMFRAKSGEVVVIDPFSGEIKALANWPTFNPQHLEDSTPEWRTNRAVVVPFETGSTIKPYIVGPAIAWNLTRPEEMWPLPRGGGYRSTLRRKLITDVHYYGPLATWDVLVKSSNTGMTMIGERLGKQRLHDAIAAFGFGRRTGIDLPGEDPGLLRPASQWGNADVVSVVQGYALMATPLQLARGMSAFANGGRLVQPHVLKGVLEDDGLIHSQSNRTSWKALPEVLDTYTAAQMRRILADVPVRGTGRSITAKTYNIFGKTGTAHVARGGNYNDTAYTSSFVGGAPYEHPRLVVALIIHEPDKSVAHYGGAVAAPGAGNVLERSLAYLQVPASPALDLPPASTQLVLHNFNPRLYAKPKQKPRPQLAGASVD